MTATASVLRRSSEFGCMDPSTLNRRAIRAWHRISTCIDHVRGGSEDPHLHLLQAGSSRGQHIELDAHVWYCMMFGYCALLRWLQVL